MHDDMTQAIEHLNDVLDRERHLLIEGHIDDLAALYPDKEAAISQLEADLMNTANGSLDDVRAKLLYNQALLESAMDGIRSVARRLAAVRRVREALEFYDEAGERTSVSVDVSRTVEKRA